MSTSSQHGHTGAMQKLLQHLDRKAVPSYDISTGELKSDIKFVPSLSVEDYFKENNFRNTKQLLAAIFSDSRDRPSTKNVAETYPRVFCILASMRMAVVQFIGVFVRHPALSDERLPFETRPHNFPIANGDDGDEFWTEFYQRQWRFSAPKLKTFHAASLDDQCVLPFTELKKAGGGGYATVYKAIVQPEYDCLTSPPRQGNVYAIKTFITRSSAEDDYRRELDAFRRITESGTRITTGIIDFYSSFEYRKTFNLVLEYAEEGTLEDYFQRHERPANGVDVINFWESLFVIIHALNKIHEHHMNPDEGEGGILLQGWHQDLKPRNILVVKNNDQLPHQLTFKIADLGLSHFKTIIEGQPEAADLDTHGTRTYGAPECYASSSTTMNRKHKITRSIDIWSLGAIYSEAATWAVNGWPNVQEYRRRRKIETDKLSDFRDGNCFHNGQTRLKAVDTHHTGLKNDLSPADFITGKVLDNMVSEMLESKPAIRPTAEQLVGKGERLIASARDELRETTIATPRTPNRPSPPSPGSPHSPTRRPEFAAGPRASTDQDDSLGFVFDQGWFTASPQPTMVPSRYGPTGHHAHPSQPQAPNIPLQNRSPTQAPQDSPYVPALIRERGGQSDEGRREDLALINEPTEVPSCSLSEAHDWYKRRKAGDKTAKLPNHGLLWELKGRDHAFLLDDSESMQLHWPRVESLIRILAYITKSMDPDGLELYFLSSGQRYTFKHSSDLAMQLRNHTPSHLTNLNTRLGEGLRQYSDAIDQSKRPRSGLHWRLNNAVRKRSIYVLTDGVWESGDNEQGHDAIRAMAKKLTEYGLGRDQIGIQFIRFGNSEIGTARLEILDNLRERLGLPVDIVDTEPADGNVWKMLLGAINPKFDNDGQSRMSPAIHRLSDRIS